MANINEKLQTMQNSKDAMKVALTAKGVDMSEKNFSEYADAITSIPAGGGVVTAFTGVKEYTSISEMGELNEYRTIGAIISYKSDDAKPWKVWNGDPENLIFNWKAIAYGNPETGEQGSAGSISYWGWNQFTLNNEYGTAIAICAGTGLWLSIAWEGSRGEHMYKWANSDTDLYNHLIGTMIYNDGRTNTKHIFSNDNYIEQSPLFAAVKTFNSGIDETENHWFLPSKSELIDIQNTSTEKLTGDTETSGGFAYKNYLCYAADINSANYWSSSQYGNYYDYAFYVDFYYGYVNYNTKGNSSMSFVALHLGTALA